MRSLSPPANRPQRPSLQAYLVTLVLLVLIPTVAIVAVALMRAGQSYRDASSRQLLETAHLVAQSVQSELQARSQLISTFALMALPTDGPADEVNLAGSDISSVLLEMTNGEWEVHSELPRGVPPEHLVQTAQRGRMTVSNLLDVETDTGTVPMIAMSTPRSVGENLVEVTTLLGPPRALVLTLMRDSSFSNDMVLAVTDGNGRILARSRDAQRAVGQRAPDWEALKAVGAPQGTFEARTVEGPLVIFAFRTIDETPGWMAVTGEPLALYNARWQQPLLVLLAVSCVTVLLALLFAALWARRILQPIKYLVEQARLVADANKPLEEAGFATAPSVVAEFDTLRESLERAGEQTRHSHAELQSSYEALRQAERVARVGSWSLDLATQRFRCSEMLYAMNGADPNGPPLTLDDLPRLVEPDSERQLRAAIERCARYGEPYGLELQCRRIGGGVFTGYVRGEAVRDEHGNIVGLRGTVHDVSELEEQRRRIAALADNLPSGAIFRVEQSADGHCVINYISAGIREIVGIPAADIMRDGRVLLGVIHPDDLQRFKDALERARDSGTQFDDEFRIRHPNGSVVWIHCRAARRKQSDDRLVWDGIARDVTPERLAAEALREAKEAAERAERSKSDFLATMSHEIRTPMNTVIGMTRLTLQTPLAPRQRNYLEKINVAAKTLLGIINDILDLSKIESGGLELEDTEFKLESVLESVSAVMAMPAEEKGLEIAYSVQPGLPRRLRGDPLRLGQVLTNLVSNAVKFTDQGEIVVSIEKVAGPDHSPWIRFRVRDTGIGLDAEQISRLFRPFTQATQDTTRRYGGTGLGLAICKRLVEMMGGTIGVVSTPGVGSTFHFSLPLRPVSDDSTTIRMAAPRIMRIRGRRALIVDDNASARQILSEMVRNFGMEAEAVDSGFRALDVLEQATLRGTPFDVVLMDWRMPTMDGLETAQRIRENSHLEHVPAVLMVTAYGREEVTHRAEQLGLQGVLIKPLTESVLFNTLIDILFPSDDEQPAEDDSAAVTAAMYAPLIGKRVLVVDDNAFNREVATDFLSAVGVVVDTAVDGQEAIEKIQSEPYDAVLMDTHMPRKDGLTATRELRRDPRFAQLPIISLTAQARVEDQQASRDAGMTAYLTKPIDETLLYRTLVQVMSLEMPADAPRRTPTRTVAATDSDDLRLEDVERRLHGAETAARLLDGFVRDFGEAPQRLRHLLAARDLEGLAALVHTVKGSASYLASSDLFEAGDAIERAARRGDLEAVKRLLPRYAKRLERLMAATRAGIEKLRAKSGAAKSDFDPQRVLDDIDRALPLIERGDYAAAGVLERIHAALQGTDHEELAHAAQLHFDELALDSAAGALSRLAEVIKE